MHLGLICAVLSAPVDLNLKAGFGKADITGPIGEIDLMGYARLGQQANGIHLRLYARAFIVGDGDKRIVYVSTDTGQVSHFTKARTIKLLNSPLYTEENLMISATHTHSGPAGYLDDFLYQANTFGIVQGEREAIAQGMANAINQAHHEFENNQGTLITVHEGKVQGSQKNRSPSSYLENPEEERAQYPDGDMDKSMVLLSFRDPVTKVLKASFSWFAVHGVSMVEQNKLVSGDNKGFASYKWEQEEPIIAAFSQSNAGDITPNTQQAVCNGTNIPCDGGKESCPETQSDGSIKYHISKCFALGPGKDTFESTKIIGQKSLDAAKQIVTSSPLATITSTIDYRHEFVDMSNIKLEFQGRTVNTCKPAMGQSFAAGTTDGPGIDLAYQGVGPVNPGLNILSHLIGRVLKDPLPKASDELEKCQAPKSVLLATGEYKLPYQWQSSVVPIQLFSLGKKFVIIAQPSEITTMAGRRLRNAVRTQMIKDKSLDEDGIVVIAGLANTYTSYVTTYEEYQKQRYEAGSTIFGPHTLSAYIDQFTKLASSFTLKNSSLNTATPVREGSYSELTLNNGLVHKIVLDGGNFGKELEKPRPNVRLGEIVTAKFQCAHPRNQKVGKSFMTVEVLNSGVWTTYLDDSGWDTKFYWERTGGQISPTSECQVSWSINETIKTDPGTYRFRIFGAAKPLIGAPKEFEGVSTEFTVTA